MTLSFFRQILSDLFQKLRFIQRSGDEGLHPFFIRLFCASDYDQRLQQLAGDPLVPKWIHPIFPAMPS